MSEWLDDDGVPYGHWAEIGIDEQRAIVADAGGLRALAVAASFTDPENEIYTAWARRDDPYPLVDTRTLRYLPMEHPRREIYRKFVARGQSR